MQKKLQIHQEAERLEREAIERAANDMEAAGSNEAEDSRDRRQRGETNAIPGDHSLAGLALNAAERTTYAGSSTDRIRAGLQDVPEKEDDVS